MHSSIDSQPQYLMEVSDQIHAPAASPPGKKLQIRSGRYAPAGIRNLNFPAPQRSLYTDYAIRAP